MNWLAVALVALTVASWASTFLLIRAARERPRIGALNERAYIAVAMSAFGTVCVWLALNTESDIARVVFRLCLVAFLLFPVYWLFLYFTHGLGDKR